MNTSTSENDTQIDDVEKIYPPFYSNQEICKDMCRRNNLRSHIECMDNSFFCILLSTNNNALDLIECQNHDDKGQYGKECNKRYKETAIKIAENVPAFIKSMDDAIDQLKLSRDKYVQLLEQTESYLYKIDSLEQMSPL